MTTYATASLVVAAAALVLAFLVPRYRKAGLVVAGAFALAGLALLGIDCAISCIRTGELYVPQR